MAVRIASVVCVLFLVTCIISSGTPTEVTHAFCKIGWSLGLPCDRVKLAIIAQIRTTGSFKLGQVTSRLIQAKHTSAAGQTERVTFTLRPEFMDQGCHVEGSSVSDLWYSKFDNSINYCNLYNVIQRSGLARAPGFTEFTNAWTCLGYGSLGCE